MNFIDEQNINRIKQQIKEVRNAVYGWTDLETLQRYVNNDDEQTDWLTQEEILFRIVAHGLAEVRSLNDPRNDGLIEFKDSYKAFCDGYSIIIVP